LSIIFWHLNPDNKAFRNWLTATTLEEIEPTESGVLKFVLGVPSRLHKEQIENYIDRFYPEIRAHYPVASSRLDDSNHGSSLATSSEPTTLDEYFHQQELKAEPAFRACLMVIRSPDLPCANKRSRWKRTARGYDVFNFRHRSNQRVCLQREPFDRRQSKHDIQSHCSSSDRPVLGKTHLMFAVWNQIRVRFPHLRVTYVDTSRFL
jgi:hypothetical protein